MSTIPPNWMASVIQSQGAQNRADEAKRKEAIEQSERAGKGDFTENLKNVIENSDRDSEVYADAEGSGGQGSPGSAEEDDEQNADAEEQAGRDDEPQGGLDVQA